MKAAPGIRPQRKKPAKNMTDITPPAAPGRQVIQGYGDGGFRIGGRDLDGSVLVFPDHTISWPVASVADMSVESFDAVTSNSLPPRILLIGCGRDFVLLSPDIQRMLSGHGIAAEIMDTGAACRTFNVLLLEDRDVAAALIAID